MKKVFCIILCLVLTVNISGCINYTSRNASPDSESKVIDTDRNTPVTETDDFTYSVTEETQISDSLAKTLWCYGCINDIQKKYYRIMLTMVKNMTEGYVLLGSIKEEYSIDVSIAFRALSYDFPEYFWMPSSYFLANDGENISVAFKRSVYEDNYVFSKFEVNDGIHKFNDEIERIVKEAEYYDTDFEKEEFIHDEICRISEYFSDSKKSQQIYTAYGAIINGQAVCEGYARAFQLICKKIGIECILVTGESKDVGHIWNMVKLDDNWYHVDVTWDDLREDPVHTYFNVTTHQIKTDHLIDDDYSFSDKEKIKLGYTYNFGVPNAQSEKLNFFNYYGLIFAADDTKSIADEIIKCLRNGETKAQFKFKNQSEYSVFKENYENYVVKIQERIDSLSPKNRIRLDTISFTGDTCVLYWEKA